jgi:mono/diheme cytochrome c family protein
MKPQQTAKPLTENPEPTASLSPVPLWMIVVFAGVFYFAQLYVDDFGGGFKAEVYEPYESFAALKAKQPPTIGVDPRGEKVYISYCSPCHQPNGVGAPGIAPPLVESEWVLAPGPNRMIRIVLNGLTGPVKVKGTDYNLTMVPWKDVLTDEDIAAVLTFVRGNSAWKHSAGPVKPEQVKAIRDKEQTRATAWTAPELEKFPEAD